MTRQYVVGELSGLIGALRPAPTAELGCAVERLRHEVEADSWGRLPALATDALELADRVCWTALEQGDVTAFQRYGRAAVALREFAAGASLIA